MWMLFFGSNDEARNYSCRIYIKNKFGNEFNYSGPVHTLDKSEKAILDSGYVLSIGSDAAKMVEENYLEIEASVQNLKIETVFRESQDFRISIKNKGNEFNYSGPVHTLDKSEKAILDSGNLLSIGSQTAKMAGENNLKLLFWKIMMVHWCNGI